MTHEELDVGETDQGGFDRRGFMRRAAVVGAATVWTAPTVQSIASPAFALGSPAGECDAWLTGGGQIRPATLNAAVIDSLSFGLSKLVCGDPKSELEVNAHDVDGIKGHDINWHFDDKFTMTCSFAAPDGEQPSPCPNKFVGSADDLDTDPANPAHLEFIFIDHGEPGSNDFVSLKVTDNNGTYFGAGSVTQGNLQAHNGDKPLANACGGC